MPIYYDRARKRWRYEFDRYVDGRRQRTTKLLPKAWSREEAQAYAHEKDNRLYLVATGAIKRRPLISEAVALYLRERAPQLKNKSLERELANCLDAYAGKHMDELADVARKYAEDHAEALKPATVRNRMSYLRAACRWAWKRHGLGAHDPGERMTLPPANNARQVYLSRLEVVRIARAIRNSEARAVVLVAFRSGMRLSECLRAVPTERGWMLADTKNGDVRLVPIDPKVAYLARRWPPATAARTVQERFRVAAEGMGRDDVTFHTLRHSAASAMVNGGVDLFAVGAVLGHKAPASTKRYAHFANDVMAAALRKIR